MTSGIYICILYHVLQLWPFETKMFLEFLRLNFCMWKVKSLLICKRHI